MKKILKSLFVAVLIQASAVGTIVTTATPSNSETANTQQITTPESPTILSRKHVWTPSRSRAYVRLKLEDIGWGKKQFRCVDKIVTRESRWTHTSDNRYSTAYGLFQILKTKPGTPVPAQTAAFIRYIKHRYETPCNAWKFHQKHGWY